MSMRAVPLSCPYCAEPDIEPAEDDSTWHCQSCDRIFELRFRGLAPS